MLHIVRGEGLRSLDPGGIDVLAASEAEFRAALVAENHTLKRALTDPGVFSGIGNAYSNEILHAAQVSALAQTQKLKAEEWARLFAAARGTLKLWIDRLVGEAGTGFPEKVTAFRADMAVHGRYGKPCPVCGKGSADSLCGQRNQLLRAVSNRRKLADRGLSRLLGSDWPRTLEELEALRRK